MPDEDNEDDGHSDDERDDDIRHLLLIHLILSTIAYLHFRRELDALHLIHNLRGELLHILILVHLSDDGDGAQSVAVHDLSVLHLVLHGGYLAQRYGLQTSENGNLLVEQVVDGSVVAAFRFDDGLWAIVAIPHLTDGQTCGITGEKRHLYDGIGQTEAAHRVVVDFHACRSQRLAEVGTHELQPVDMPQVRHDTVSSRCNIC